MAENIDTAELPTISADPLQLVVDFGSPSYLLKNQRRHKQLYDELQLLKRTNDYRPTHFTVATQLNPVVKRLYQSVPELRDVGETWTTRLLKDDLEKNRLFEQFDPLKGNALVVTAYMDTELMIFGAGPSLSSLVLATLEKENKVRYSVDLEYPIRQISLSPLSTHDLVIFLVRTTSSIHLFEMDEKISVIHKLNFPQLSEINPLVDYSMPVDAQLSPYSKHDYLFVTNNGYMALIDGANQQTKFENVDAIDETTRYESRWRSCGFGITLTSIFIATPECVKAFTFRDTLVVSKTLATPKENIVAFKTNGRMYGYATQTSIVVMDIVSHERPLFTWLHRMRDGPPTELIFGCHEDQWRITAFSNITQRFSMLFFKGPIETEIQELHHFSLPIFKFEELFNYTSRIHTVGCCILAPENKVYRIYRAFEDGSIRVQYMTLGDTECIVPTVTPFICESKHFGKLVADTEQSVAPECRGLLSTMEVVQVNAGYYVDYVDQVISGSEKITDTSKRNIAQQLDLLKSATPFREIYKNFEWHGIKELEEFKDQMLLHEDIQLLPQLTTPGINSKGGPTRLNEAHEKVITLSRHIIRPIRENTARFQYLDKDLVYQSTTTSKALAELWPVDEESFDRLVYPTLETEHVLKPERFESRHKRALEEEEPEQEQRPETRSLDIPETSSASSNFAFTSTQPLPGVFGSRTKKPKKKVKKTSGFK